MLPALKGELVQGVSERNDRAKEELEETDAHMSGDDEDKSGDDEDGDGQSDYDPGNTMGVATRSLGFVDTARRSTRRNNVDSRSYHYCTVHHALILRFLLLYCTVTNTKYAMRASVTS